MSGVVVVTLCYFEISEVKGGRAHSFRSAERITAGPRVLGTTSETSTQTGADMIGIESRP